jgi:hypothetical protein
VTRQNLFVFVEDFLADQPGVLSEIHRFKKLALAL